MDRITLFQLMSNAFNLAELQVLCFELNMDYEGLGGSTKPEKLLELIGYCVRRNNLHTLEIAVRQARPALFVEIATRQPYGVSISFPIDSVKEALETISWLSQPDSWEQLCLERALVNGGWMGSASAALVNMLYRLYHPAVLSELAKYEVERNFAFLDWRSRLQFILLDNAAHAIMHDRKFAAIAPQIDYTPRVPGWRRLREKEPAKYWWQCP